MVLWSFPICLHERYHSISHKQSIFNQFTFFLNLPFVFRFYNYSKMELSFAYWAGPSLQLSSYRCMVLICNSFFRNASKIKFSYIMSLQNSMTSKNCCAFEGYNISCSAIIGGVSNPQFNFYNSNFHTKTNIYLNYNYPNIVKINSYLSNI